MDNPKTPASSSANLHSHTDDDATITADNDVTITVENDVTIRRDNNIDPDATEIVSPTLASDDATLVVSPNQSTTTYSQVSDFAAEGQGMLPVSIDVGTVINQRFTLKTLLGRGGMGDVYLASDKRKIEAQDSDPYIAIKLLGENFKKHPQAFVALQREARKTQQLAHPNIVTVYDFDRQADIVYLTMEALTGDPLDHIIKNFHQEHDIKTIIDVINQCAQGLSYAHQKGLIHSDLKPGNVFITKDNHVKLLDFGIARAFNSGKSLDKSSKHSQQDTVFDAGELGALTPAYASLEMIQGRTPTPSDDIYALGIIAYQLLTGKHPFDHVKADSAAEDKLQPEKIPGISKKQWQAIEQALQFKQEDRLKDAEEFYKAFNAKSRAPLIAATTLTSIAFILVASLNVWFAPATGPDIAFKDLPVQTQNAVQQQLKDSTTALKFNDYNSAILHLDKAYLLHPRNKEVMKAIDNVVEALLVTLNDPAQFDAQSREKQITSLLRYASLKNNQQLKASLNKK